MDWVFDKISPNKTEKHCTKLFSYWFWSPFLEVRLTEEANSQNRTNWVRIGRYQWCIIWKSSVVELTIIRVQRLAVSYPSSLPRKLFGENLGRCNWTALNENYVSRKNENKTISLWDYVKFSPLQHKSAISPVMVGNFFTMNLFPCRSVLKIQLTWNKKSGTLWPSYFSGVAVRWPALLARRCFLLTPNKLQWLMWKNV